MDSSGPWKVMIATTCGHSQRTEALGQHYRHDLRSWPAVPAGLPSYSALARGRPEGTVLVPAGLDWPSGPIAPYANRILGASKSLKPCLQFRLQNQPIRPHGGLLRGARLTEARVMALQGCVSTGRCEPKRSMDGLERALESHDRGDVDTINRVSKRPRKGAVGTRAPTLILVA